MRQKIGKRYRVKNARGVIIAEGTVRECSEQLGVHITHVRKLLREATVPKNPKYFFEHLPPVRPEAPPFNPLDLSQLSREIVYNNNNKSVASLLRKCDIETETFRRIKKGDGNPSTFALEVLLGEVGLIDLKQETLSERILQVKEYALSQPSLSPSEKKRVHNTFQRSSRGQTLRLSTLIELAELTDIDPRWFLGLKGKE